MLIGNGGHSLSIKDCVMKEGTIIAYGGIRPESLRDRLKDSKKHHNLATAIHPTAVISQSAVIGEGSQILAMAYIGPGASVGKMCIINTGSIVEHGSVVGDGSHIAPRAVVLGDATVGRCCMIGAGAVVIQGSTVPDDTMVRALTIYKS